MSNQQPATSNQLTRFTFLLSAVCCLLSAFVNAGCAVLGPSIPRPRHRFSNVASEAAKEGTRDLVGIIHFHTTYSHDAHGKLEDAIRVANAQGLDYLIVTEHNNLKPLADGYQGWHGSVLVLVGVEISTRSGHYVALNITHEIDRQQLTTQEIIDEVNRQGGFGFIAHPFFKHGRWRDWSVHGFTGLEGYNVAHDTLDENKIRLILWTLFAPREPFYESILDRPYDPLSMWDHLIAERGKIVGIGASDAHEFHAFGLKFAPYEDMFRLSRTHVLIPNNTETTPAAIYDALKAGHAYFSIELTAEAKGFRFVAQDRRRTVGIMGDDVVFTPGLQLLVSLPLSADMTLMKDGSALEHHRGTAWEIPVHEAGVYRLEVSRRHEPWIFSNPIYVRPGRSDENDSAPAPPNRAAAQEAPIEPALPATPVQGMLRPQLPSIPSRSQDAQLRH